MLDSLVFLYDTFSFQEFTIGIDVDHLPGFWQGWLNAKEAICPFSKFSGSHTRKVQRDSDAPLFNSMVEHMFWL